MARQRKHLLSEELQPTYVVAHVKGSIFSAKSLTAHLRGGACQRKHLLSEELQPTYVVAHVKGSIFSAEKKRQLAPPRRWAEAQPTYVVAHVKGSIFSAKSLTAHLRGGARQRKHLLSEELPLSPPTWWRSLSKEASSQRRASAHLRGGACVKGSIFSAKSLTAHLRGGACQRKHLLSEELQPTYVVALRSNASFECATT